MNLIALQMALEIEHTLQALKAVDPAERLSKELQKIMNQVTREIVAQLGNMSGIPTEGNIHARNQLTALLVNRKDNLNQVLSMASVHSATSGNNQIKRGLEKAGVAVQFDKLSPGTMNAIQDRALGTSQRIINHGIDRVYGSLAKSYEQGLGINEAAANLREALNTYSDGQLKTVARTEIQGAQNAAAHQLIKDNALEHEQWWTSDDERVRGNNPNDKADHTVMHGQIVRTRDTFSNGLMHPGDRNGDIKEWINCRCRVVPFIMPLGMQAPMGRSHFYESDLIPVE